MSNILNLLQYGRKLPNATSAIDNIVNPNTYKALFGQIDDVLQRSLPGKFQGAGIQNAPTNLIGQVSDIANMPSGAAREAARNQLKRNFQMAGRLDDVVRPTGGQAASGALRAPGISKDIRSYDLVNPRGARATSGPFKGYDLNSNFQGPGLPPSKIKPGPIIPSGGQKAPPLTAFGGVNPIVGNTPNQIVSKGVNKSLIQQASQYMPKGPLGLLGRGNQAYQGAAIVNSLKKGDYGNAAVNAAMMFPGRTLGAAQRLLLNPVAATTGVALTAAELMFPARIADGTMDSPEAKRAEELYRQQQYDREQGADLDMEAIRNLPGGANNPLPPFDPNQNLPASAEQALEPTILEQQMTLYDQGRRAATTQAERNQVRDLGLAIHKAHNPHLYSNFQTPMASDRTFNPLMEGIKTSMFPEGYPSTMEGFIQGGGVQMPYTMTDKDARNQVIEGNRLEGTAKAAKKANDLRAQEFMQKVLNAQTGAK